VALIVLVGFAAGLALGALHFAGLWQTLGRLPRTRMPGMLMVASLVGRLAVLLGGFYLLAHWGGWPALVAGLVGVVAARSWLLRRIGPGAEAREDSP